MHYLTLKKILIIVFPTLLFIVIINFLFTTKPLTNEVTIGLFGKKVEYQLLYNIDYSGISNHGERFEFFEYELELNNVNLDNLKNYPLWLNNIFKSSAINSCDTIKWRPTPLFSSNDSDYYSSTFGFADVSQDNRSSIVIQNNYINKKGNYYAFFSSMYTGNYFYLLVPSEKKLFLIIKRI